MAQRRSDTMIHEIFTRTRMSQVVLSCPLNRYMIDRYLFARYEERVSRADSSESLVLGGISMVGL